MGNMDGLRSIGMDYWDYGWTTVDWELIGMDYGDYVWTTGDREYNFMFTIDYG